ncbi:hypothetical protein AXA65_07665 [Chryseobacterium sp. FP211-J200]|nr:hypothetical protein AXA65_07665 [Chryseobacterium sp. FP211-J200]
MKNIIKSIIATLLIAIVFVACTDDADRDWTSPEASFKLYNTTLGSSVLYETMENNPFVLTWDKTGSSEYSVVFSLKEDFSNKVTLGTSTTNTFATTIGDINNKFLQAGASPYSASTIYVRIESGSEVSNTISFGVTPYPVAGPMITAPTAGSIVTLDVTKPEELVKINWNDYSSGVDVKYTIDLSKKGGSFINLGTVISTVAAPIKTLELTSKDFVFALLNAGASANVQSEFDIKVTAETKSTGGTITLVSNVVAFKATPYEVTSYLYAPGAYQGWNIDTAESLISPKSDGIYTGYIKFVEANSEFKITPARTWTNSYGTDDNINLIYNGGGNIKATNTGYQKLTVNTNTLVFSLEAYSWGIIGDATPGEWSADTDMTWNSTNQTWEIANVALVGGKDVKFRLNDDWGTNYGGSNGNLAAGGDNIKVTESGNYKIVMDLVNLKYTLTKL